MAVNANGSLVNRGPVERIKFGFWLPHGMCLTRAKRAYRPELGRRASPRPSTKGLRLGLAEIPAVFALAQTVFIFFGFTRLYWALLGLTGHHFGAGAIKRPGCRINVRDSVDLIVCVLNINSKLLYDGFLKVSNCSKSDEAHLQMSRARYGAQQGISGLLARRVTCCDF